MIRDLIFGIGILVVGAIMAMFMLPRSWVAAIIVGFISGGGRRNCNNRGLEKGVVPMNFNPYIPDFTSWPEQGTGAKRGDVSRGT